MYSGTPGSCPVGVMPVSPTIIAIQGTPCSWTTSCTVTIPGCSLSFAAALASRSALATSGSVSRISLPAAGSP